MSELKPCPFCGGENVEWDALYFDPGDGFDFFPGCTDCGNGISQDAWNHRPIEDQLRSDLEAARAELSETNDHLTEATEFAERMQRECAQALAELAAERGRLDWCLEQLVLGGDLLQRYTPIYPEFIGTPIPVGQSARDVIDRLIKEGGE